ncbi:response regulator transcription factor [Bacillus sp. FJAT-42315]|uniref:response regulator transcription factor n=1 Tax=Bacillus sp. FJAT-42315 TaxID=2014077 RepID=UPI0018E1ECD2|nr:response regulator transcription factor [Bacillus sp. FJAT-42315]
MKVLIVDDEQKITTVVASYFAQNGDEPFTAHNGKEALQIINETPLDMIILDLMLPDMSGEEICQYVKEYYAIPVIMLTAKISIDDKVKGFQAGADDYVVKPFHPKEILIRAERLLPDAKKAKTISFGALTIYIEERRVQLNGESILLTQNEFNILLLLVEHPKQAFSREAMIQKLFGYDTEASSRSIDQHIKNIRKKIGADYIQTVFGLGYKMNEKVRLQ